MCQLTILAKNSSRCSAVDVLGLISKSKTPPLPLCFDSSCIAVRIKVAGNLAGFFSKRLIFIYLRIHWFGFWFFFWWSKLILTNSKNSLDGSYSWHMRLKAVKSSVLVANNWSIMVFVLWGELVVVVNVTYLGRRLLPKRSRKLDRSVCSFLVKV